MQLRTSTVIYSFHENFKNKFNFEEYESIYKPTLFFGVYRKHDIRAISEHKGKKFIWLAGTDATKPSTMRALASRSEFKDAIFIAESKWIEKDLDEYGIKYESLRFFMDDLFKWKPEELGDKLYWYGANNSKYGKKYLNIVKRAIPDLEIITHDFGTVPKSEMANVYKECFAGIRPVDHDGMSQTVIEMGLMGRMSIWNGGGPFAVRYDDVDEMISLINMLRQGYNHKLIAKRTREYFKEQEAKWSELILKHCRLGELDWTGIFEDSNGRCPSMFRIQRKSVIEKIGGLGSEQFERPWFAEQMDKLGKRQLITRKSSGWIANEWKGGGNKGYPEGFIPRTYDERYD